MKSIIILLNTQNAEEIHKQKYITQLALSRWFHLALLKISIDFYVNDYINSITYNSQNSVDVYQKYTN